MAATATQVSPDPARPARLRRLPGLDGLRAVAVVAVIIYHLNPSVLPGGFLGVDIFFVLSGYLITSILLAEMRRRRTIGLPDFWRRRARRLFPAVGVLLFATTLLSAAFARDTLARLRVDVPACLGYVMNWRLVFEHKSYIESLGRPPLLLHLWSLSVEEQFYLLWPPVLLLIGRRLGRLTVARVAAAAAVLSSVLMAVLYSPGDPSAVYFATYTHAQGLLIGSALAAALPPWGMVPRIDPAARRTIERTGVAALVALAAGLGLLGFESAVTYRGGMVAVDLATAVAIAAAAHPACRLGRVLSSQPLRWLGLRSYSLYLWHWPIFVLTTPAVGGVGGLALRLGLTAGAAEASYRWIEQPWRTGSAQAALRRLAEPGKTRYPLWSGVGAAAMAALIVVLVTAPDPQEPSILRLGETAAARVAPTVSSEPVLAPVPTTALTTATAAPTQTVTTSTTVPPPPPPPGPVPQADLPILAIGDSVLLAASPALESTFGSQITIDAAVGRQVSVGLTRLEQYRSSGALAHYRTVVVDLGTNGTFQPYQFRQLAQLLAGVPVVAVFDVHADRSWTAASNSTIEAGVAANQPTMTLVDWNHYAAANLLYSDGIHPNAQGAEVFTSLLIRALDNHSPAPPTTTTTAPPPTTTTAPPATTTTAPPRTAPPATTASPSTTSPTTTAPPPPAG